MLNVAIGGAGGRMGKALIQAAIENRQINIGAASVLEDSHDLGKDVGLIGGMDPLHVVTVDDLEQVVDDFQVLIDFTGTENLSSLVRPVSAKQKNSISRKSRNRFPWSLRPT